MASFDDFVTEVCFSTCDWLHIIIRLDKGLALNRRQAGIQTNDDTVWRRTYAALREMS